MRLHPRRRLVACLLWIALLLLVLAASSNTGSSTRQEAYAQSRSTPTPTQEGALPTATPVPGAGGEVVAVAITSPRTSDTPLLASVTCSVGKKSNGILKTPFDLVVETWTREGASLVLRKSVRLFSSRENEWPYAYNDSCYDSPATSGPGGSTLDDTDFDCAFDSTWFPVIGEYVVVVRLTEKGSSRILAENTTGPFTRPIARPSGLVASGPAFATSSNGGVSTNLSRGPFSVNWNTVDGARSYELRGTRPDNSSFTVQTGATNRVLVPGETTIDGRYRLAVRAQGDAGWGPWSDEAAITLDTTPPLPGGVGVPDPGAITNKHPYFWLVRWNAVADAPYYRLELGAPDGTTQRFEPIIYCSSGATCERRNGLNPAAAPQGSYNVYVLAYDAAGNTAPRSAPATVVYDTLPPLPPASVAVAPPITNGSPVVVSWDAVADAQRYLLTLRSPAGTLTDLAPQPANGRSLSIALPATDGSYELRIRAEDAAGNISTTYRAASVERDTLPPPQPDLPRLAALTNARTTPVSWNGTPDTNRYLLRLTRPNGSVATFTVAAPTTSLPDLPLDSDGVYQLTLTSEDAAGNRSPASPAATIERDTEAPPRQPQAPTGPTLINTRAVTIGWQQAASAVSTVVSLTTQVGTSQTIVAAPAATATLALTWGDGTYQVATAGRDAAGNVASFSPPLVIVLDTVPPAAPASPPFLADRTADPTPTITWPAVADAAGYEIWVNGTRFATVLTPSVTLRGNDGDQLAVQVRAVDAAGNNGSFTPVVTTRIDRSAPAVALSLVAAPDGSGAEFAWYVEEGATVQLVRLLADGREQPSAAVSPAFFQAGYGEEVRGRLVVTSSTGISITAPFGPIVPNHIGLAGTLRDENGGTLLPGDLLVATLSISNSGAADQPLATIALTLPEELDLVQAQPAPLSGRPLRWRMGTLPAGASRTIALTLRLKPEAAGRSTMISPTLTSSIAPAQALRLAGGLVAPLGGRLVPTLDLADSNGGLLLLGDTVALTLTLEAQDADFSGLLAEVPLPAWLAIADPGTATLADKQLRWTIESLPAGQRAVLRATGRIATGASGQTLTITPSVQSHQSGTLAVATRRLGPVIDPADRPHVVGAFLPLLAN